MAEGLLGGAARDPHKWAVIADGENGHVLFAERASRADAEEVAEQYAPLIRRCFGEPRVAPPIVSDLSERRMRRAWRALEDAGFVEG